MSSNSQTEICRYIGAIKEKYRHSRESGNHFIFAAKPPNLRGFAARKQRFPLSRE
jgi:hypothetical protein